MKKTSICLIIIVLPFLLFHWMIPFITNSTIKGDYLTYSFRPQMELLFSLKTGSCPLYVPGFAGGHSSSALTLAQFFHPLSHLASIMPGYWNGKAIEWNNLIKLLSLGLSQLAIFFFLRKSGLNNFMSFLFSFITTYNLRVIDLYRYGASLEAYTAFLLLCSAIGCYFIKPTRLIGPLCISGATYMLVCSGHPPIMYYGLIGTALFILVAPFYLLTMLPDRQFDIKTIFKSLGLVCLFFFLGIILASSYILPFYLDFTMVGVDRIGQNYAWADSNLDTFFGTVNNFFLPLHSDTYGAFGGSSLTLIAVVIPLLLFFKVKVPRSIWTVWGIVLFIFLFMQGSRTPIHRIVWEYVPFASSIRVAGRISLIMPFFIMLLLAWVVKVKPITLRLRRSSISLYPSTLLAYLSLLSAIIYYFFYVAAYNMLSFIKLQEVFTYPIGALFNIPFFWVTSIIFFIGIISLILFAVYSERGVKTTLLGIMLTIAIITQLGVVFKFRSAHWITNTYDSPTFNEMIKQKKIKLDYLYYPGGGLHSSVVITQINRSFMEPFLGKIFTHVIPVSNRDAAYERMRLERFPQQVFVEGYNPEKAKAISEGAKDMMNGAVKLAYSSFNRLLFRVNSEAPALFGLSYPFSGHWSAWVNGEKVHIYRANGAAHAVEIPAGESKIEFRYWSSAFFRGIVISCTTFAVIGLFICFRTLSGLPRIIGVVFILIISTCIFLLWHNSLYSGDNLETEYTWTYMLPLKTPNLAYGKKSWINTSANPMPYAHTRKEAKISRLVDGDRSPQSGFSSRFSDSPAWFLDLYNKESIKTILLYESRQDQLINVRPLDISLSNDGNKWSTVATVVLPAKHNVPTRIVFEKPQTARYIRIMVSGESILSFDEVEVYAP